MCSKLICIIFLCSIVLKINSFLPIHYRNSICTNHRHEKPIMLSSNDIDDVTSSFDQNNVEGFNWLKNIAIVNNKFNSETVYGSIIDYDVISVNHMISNFDSYIILFNLYIKYLIQPCQLSL